MFILYIYYYDLLLLVLNELANIISIVSICFYFMIKYRNNSLKYREDNLLKKLEIYV